MYKFISEKPTLLLLIVFLKLGMRVHRKIVKLCGLGFKQRCNRA